MSKSTLSAFPPNLWLPPPSPKLCRPRYVHLYVHVTWIRWSLLRRGVDTLLWSVHAGNRRKRPVRIAEYPCYVHLRVHVSWIRWSLGWEGRSYPPFVKTLVMQIRAALQDLMDTISANCVE